MPCNLQVVFASSLYQDHSTFVLPQGKYNVSMAFDACLLQQLIVLELALVK